MSELQLHAEPTPGLIPLTDVEPVLREGKWYESPVSGEGLVYNFAAGKLAGYRWLSADFISPAETDLALILELHEEGSSLPCICRFTLLPQAQARFRFDLNAVNQNRWRYHREGACLKPTMSGARVALAKVHRLKIKVLYKKSGPARFGMTLLRPSVEKPPLLLHPLLLRSRLLDELGQASFRNWQGKTRDEAELKTRLTGQLDRAKEKNFPPSYSSWGGWREKKAAGNGFFRTHHDGRRWWLLDPEGYYFWSTGPCCARPDIESNIRLLRDALAWLPPQDGTYGECFHGEGPSNGNESEKEIEGFDYLKANFIRVFGKDWKAKWRQLVFPLMREIGFNTSANWSDVAAAESARMPYVFPMVPAEPAQRTPRIFRDLPDVFSSQFEVEAAAFASQLEAGKEDPARIGYFLMNEPQWAFTDLTVAEGMMWNCEDCATRRIFAEELRARYETDSCLQETWKMKVTLGGVAVGKWQEPFTEEALVDLRKFSSRIASHFYKLLDESCRKVDPNHLNLGARFSSVPKDWLVDAVAGFDVFSINCYQPKPDPRLEEICRKWNVPAMIGEWHYGALDAGLPAPGIGHVADQAARGQAYRYYVESSAVRPWCVGAHWFTLYDQSALGRGDGENYNIGFVDTCHRIYEPLSEAARKTHERLYQVAAGLEEPFSEAPEIMERLNM